MRNKSKKLREEVNHTYASCFVVAYSKKIMEETD